MYYGNIMISEAKAPRNWWSLPFSFGTFYFNYISGGTIYGSI